MGEFDATIDESQCFSDHSEANKELYAQHAMFEIKETTKGLVERMEMMAPSVDEVNLAMARWGRTLIGSEKALCARARPVP